MQHDPYRDLKQQLNDLLTDCHVEMNHGDQGLITLENLTRQAMTLRMHSHLAINALKQAAGAYDELRAILGADRLSLRDRIARQTGLPDPNAAYGPYDPVVQDRRTG